MSENISNNLLIQNTTNDLNSFFDYITNRIEQTVFSEKVAGEFFNEVKTELKNRLNRVFGAEKDINDKGYVSDFLNYYDPDVPFSGAVSFSYWSLTGEKDHYVESLQGKYRENLFYKGLRWSKKVLREIFYTYHDLIQEIASEGTPVNFFVRIGTHSNLTYFKLICDDNPCIDDDTTICLPTENRLSKHKFLPKTHQYLKKIKYLKSYTAHSEERAMQFLDEDVPKMGDIRGMFCDATEELCKEGAEILEAAKDNITTVFNANHLSNETIAKVILCFLYYDHPYDIHFFLPNTAPDKKNDESALIISTKKNSSSIDGFKETLLVLAEAASRISAVENKIWRKLQECLPIFWQWKKYYQEWTEKYQRISSMVVGICRLICKNHGITFHNPTRVKSFDSFYDKICDIANNINNERAEEFTKLINEAKRSGAKEIFHGVGDILGVRVVCAYEDDIKKIIKEFHTLKDKDEIVITKEVDYIQSVESRDTPDNVNAFDYRSYHLTFKLGPHRLTLYEYKDLEGLECELQIRTILSDGWASVAHDTVYKPRIKLLDSASLEKLEDQKRMLYGLSGVLYTTDKNLISIRDTINELVSDSEKD